MKKHSFSPKKRLASLFIVVLILALGLVLRLAYLQLYKGEELRKGALQQWTRGVTIKSKRGTIYDRNGKKLANTVVASTIWASPNDIRKNYSKKTGEIAKGLSETLGMEQEEVLEILNSKSNNVKVKQWATREEANALKELSLPGIQIVENNRRQYPYGKFAPYILGFTDIDNNGLYGVEKTFDKYLKGTHGKKVKTTDNVGGQLPFDGETTYEARDGLSLVLTLDETLQKFAEKAVDEAYETTKAKNISVIMMEPNTGDILAMVNKPDYDPNNPREPLNEEMAKEWESLSPQELQEKWFDNWRNFAINDVYEPGSTFKVIAAAAVMEENLAQPNTGFYCNGFVNVSGTILRCSKWYDPHKNQTLAQGLANSCNIVSVETGRKLGKETFYKYLKAFGFGDTSGIDLNGEEFGLIPPSVDDIKDVNLATMSYGHGVAITPIQLINAVSAISNGGNLMKPRIVKEMLDEKGNVVETLDPQIRRKVISESTSKKMLDMMEGVVTKGSGRNAGIPGYRIGGKTGTADKVIDGKYVKGKYIGSFVGVAPVDDPQVVILVVVDDPEGTYYGGTVAAPIAKQIFEEALPYLNIPKVVEENSKKKADDMVLVPDVRGKRLEDAGRIIKDANLKFATEYVDLNLDSKVMEQIPAPNTYLPKGGILDLMFELSYERLDAVMPDLVGKTKEEAIAILDEYGLKYSVTGEGKVLVQTPEAGTELSKETNIIVELGGEEE